MKLNLIKNLETPEGFYNIIPTNLAENLNFRQELHSYLATDKSAQKVFLSLCLQNPKIAFDALFWTFNPRKPMGYRHWPFILRPQQELAVDALSDAIMGPEPHDMLIDKSRDEGATELIAKIFGLYFLLVPDTMFLVGSRKDEFVDAATTINGNRVGGSPKCIFHKILYGLAHLPNWIPVNVDKTKNHLENKDNNSITDGESTNENFAAGDRRTAIMLDEFGRVDHKLAQNIRDSVADVTDCVIYNSTHFYGTGHPFAKLRRSGKIKVFVLPWYKNPEKTKGLYRSPDLDKIELIDKKYYDNICPEVFNSLKTGQPFAYGQFERHCLTLPEPIQQQMEGIKFLADGSNKYRSVWYDKEVERRDPRDVQQNIDMSPIGAGETFFDMPSLIQIRAERLRQPNYQGELKFKFTKDKGKLYNIQFANNFGKKRLKWWGKLDHNRPDQSHNYIVACDISMGTGSSNSAASIVDINTGEKIGIFVTPELSPEDFATYCVAICYWVGGTTGKAFLIWESNGGQGQLFDKRRRLLGFSFVYTDANERSKGRTTVNKYGWFSTRNKKFDMLAELRAAIIEGLKIKPVHKALKIYDEKSLDEYDDYIFYENGDIGQSSCMDETSGAKAAHGDRVIADGLAILAMTVQPKASAVEQAKLKPGTFMYRRYLRQQEKRKQDNNSPWI